MANTHNNVCKTSKLIQLRNPVSLDLSGCSLWTSCTVTARLPCILNLLALSLQMLLELAMQSKQFATAL